MLLCYDDKWSANVIDCKTDKKIRRKSWLDWRDTFISVTLLSSSHVEVVVVVVVVAFAVVVIEEMRICYLSVMTFTLH